MDSSITPNPLSYVPDVQSQGNGVGRMSASPGAAQKFAMLMYSPSAQASNAGLAAPATPERSGLRYYFEQLSDRWQSGQRALERLTASGKYTSAELVETHLAMINCTVDMEITSKCASTFENGVQTLIHRGS
ncbi:hypothetical protein [Peristeroidobacter agariperforans]|uniref:hypothetical protein n=1 Tax=Peristeroidobacter agariperforans TaxID=268404 RepID=UPI00101C0B49|nr:hypothetical protein [Peristeroidobacter agariperforans]